MIIAMAGLPGTGKSTLSRALSKIVGGIVLDKDSVRASVFPPQWIDFSNVQDDLCVEIMLMVAKYILDKDNKSIIIFDGRTFSRSYQIEYLKGFAQNACADLKLIECVCSDKMVRTRLTNDKKDHIAKNRDFELYLRLKNAADTIPYPKLIVNTEKMSVTECVKEILSFLDLQSKVECIGTRIDEQG